MDEMFGPKPLPGIVELYEESRNGNCAQTFEHSTLEVERPDAFDPELARHARAGWEVDGISIAGNTSKAVIFFALMRRPVKP